MFQLSGSCCRSFPGCCSAAPLKPLTRRASDGLVWRAESRWTKPIPWSLCGGIVSSLFDWSDKGFSVTFGWSSRHLLNSTETGSLNMWKPLPEGFKHQGVRMGLYKVDYDLT